VLLMTSSEGGRITVEADPRQRPDRRACVSLLVLGILTLLMFGSMASAILRQSEGLGVGVAFMIIPLLIPFAIALVCTLAFSSQALSKGSRAFPKCLVIWCIAAAVFTAQLVMLDRIAGGARFARTTVAFYSIVGFGSLLLLVVTPWWWLVALSHRRVEGSH
jgi:hypothetical protein